MSFLKYFNNKYLVLQYLYVLIFSFIIYLFIYIYKYLIYTNLFYYFNNLFYINNILGYSLFFTGIFCGLIIFFLLDTRIYFYKFIFINLFIFFLILIWLLINETSYIYIFIFYELFLLPSFLLVYFISPNRRGIIASIYFLMWTQLGSFFVLLAIIYIYIYTKSIYILYNINININVILFLFFFGFGIKIPIWPFYYWLTKTHVEASSFFSIYLSGFLVKTAIYSFNYFYMYYSNIFYINYIYIIILFGILDSSLKMWHQIDLKKLIAYSTVQEMNIIFLPLLFNNVKTTFVVSLFVITHCLLSTLFFFIIDILYKRFFTRTTTKITGLMHLTPNISIMIFISLILFSGLPFTIKFFTEIYLYNIFFNFDVNSFCFILIVCNWVGIIGFSKNFFNILFGSPIIVDKIIYDLTKKELFVFIFIIKFLFIILFFTHLYF